MGDVFRADAKEAERRALASDSIKNMLKHPEDPIPFMEHGADIVTILQGLREIMPEPPLEYAVNTKALNADKENAVKYAERLKQEAAVKIKTPPALHQKKVLQK